MYSIIFNRELNKNYKNSDFFVEDISKELDNDSHWSVDLEKLQKGIIGLHLAILHEPYLKLVLDRKKTIETRFSVHRQSPFKQIERNDIILLKQNSGPLMGLCRVSDVWFYELNHNTWDIIKNNYLKEIWSKIKNFGKKKENRLMHH